MPVQIGTCSWNYDSWVNIVYSRKQSRAVDYLPEYSHKYQTVEIDSWFYKIPLRTEVSEYLSAADENISFACKLYNGITLTHQRLKNGKQFSHPNDSFLSPELYAEYINATVEMHPRISAIQLEFEYLNRQKMPSQDSFLKYLDTFFASVEKPVPLAVETRNSNYLHKEYFELLKKWNVSHVFSEKMYMPHIYDVYERFGAYLNDRVILRLLGGDRKKIEMTTGGKWDTIVDEKEELSEIIAMVNSLADEGKSVFIYVNNHYEGCAPKTIEKMKAAIV